MERSERDTPPRNEVAILLAIARRLEREGNIQGAINSYQLALAHLSQDDPRRAEMRIRIGELEQHQGNAQAPEAPFLVNPTPQTSPESLSARPTIPSPARPRPAERKQDPSQSRQPAPKERLAGQNQRIIKPIGIRLFTGCAVLLGLALPVLVALFFLQSGFPSWPGIGARAAGQAVPTPTARVTSSAQRAPTAALPSSASATPPSGAASPTGAKQAIVVFEDSFDRTTLDGGKWIVDNTSNVTIDLSQGTLRLSSSSSRYPYIHSRVNPFPTTGDFRATVRFQYTSAGACGVPVAMASFVLPAGLSRADTDRLSSGAEANGISVWFWRNVAYYRAGSVREDISFNPLSGWHIATVDYTSGKYRLAIDNTPIYTSSQSTARPAVLWFGVPFDLGSGQNCSWDSLEISNVRVEFLR